MVLGRLSSHVQKNEALPCSTNKNQLKTDERFNVRPETMKLQEENMGARSLPSVVAIIFFFLDFVPNAKQREGK